MFAGVTSSSRATCPNTEMRRRDRRWDCEVRPVRCSSLHHHFGLGRTIGFQAAVSDTSDEKHPESSYQLIVLCMHEFIYCFFVCLRADLIQCSAARN